MSFKCNCCGKSVAYKNIYTKGSILFNGCKNCYDYLSELLNNLKIKKNNLEHIKWDVIRDKEW